MYNLTTNKLDVSIFHFKDKPIFKKREPSPPPSVGKNAGMLTRESAEKGGFEDLRQTKPSKKTLQKVEPTDFNLDEQAYKDLATSKQSVNSQIKPPQVAPVSP